jgi:hypothetical protein
MTYRGVPKSDRFQLDIVIERLDPEVTYPRDFDVPEARRGLMIDDRLFTLETIMPRYLRLRASDYR